MTGRSLISVSSITEIIDEGQITEIIEENPGKKNLISQCLNSENQENDGKRNGIKKDEEEITKQLQSPKGRMEFF